MSRPTVEVRFRGSLPAEVGATAAYDAAAALGHTVGARLDAPCQIIVNANRQRVLWWRKRNGVVEMSVHWALLPHPDDVIAWLDQEPGAIERLRSLLPGASSGPPNAPLARKRGAQGHVHDLEPWLARERERWPACPPEVFVEWGDWPRVAPTRSLKLGSCLPPRIRIHPVLDDASVPGWFIGFIVFHEVLHLQYPPQTGRTGRRQIHNREFRIAEHGHPDHDRAQAFERAHIGAWLARCRDHVHQARR
ncbi:MAG: hypothetical protein AAGA48_02380 [Myxococcota bacterium]